MIYGVKSKLYTRYLKTFNTYSEARVFALKQRQVWTNAIMEIWEHSEPGSDRILEELPPVKPTNYMKLRKSDIKGNFELTVDPAQIYHEDDEFYPESEAEYAMRIKKEQEEHAKKVVLVLVEASGLGAKQKGGLTSRQITKLFNKLEAIYET